MKYSKTVIVAIMFLLVLTMGCMSLQSEDVKEEKKSLSLADCLNKTGSMRDTCLYGLAEAKNEVAACEAINATYLRDECIRHLARRTHDPKTCLPISDTNKVVYCIASVKADKDICERLGEPAKSTCKAHVTGNPGVCTEILDASQRTTCLTQASLGSNTDAGCKLIEEVVDRDSCLMQTAVQSKSTDLCLLVADGGLKHRCLTKVELKKQLMGG